MAYIVDSYSESNYVGTSSLLYSAQSKVGQSFTGDGGILSSAKFYLRKVGSPTGNAVVKIYAHTGTFGSSSMPTGTSLATSDTFDVSTLTTANQLINFNFSGANKIQLIDETKYVVVIEYSGGDASSYILVGLDATSPTHDGNYYSTYGASSSVDTCFYVYADDTDSIVGPFPTFKR